MSEEEKKAIEYLRNLIEIEEVLVKEDINSDGRLKMYNILLNLIENSIPKSKIKELRDEVYEEAKMANESIRYACTTEDMEERLLEYRKYCAKADILEELLDERD